MAPKIPGVEDSLPVGLHQQCIGVESTVVHQVGRHSKGTDLRRGPVGDKQGFGDRVSPWDVFTRGLQDVVCFPANVHRHLGTDVPGQAVVVQVGVGNNHPQQAVVRLAESRNIGQQAVAMLVVPVQRQAQVQDNAAAP